MGNEEYVLPGGVMINAQAADKLLDCADGNAALLYIYILRNGGKLSLPQAAERLKMGAGAEAAANRLRELGLIEGAVQSREPEPEKETPSAGGEKRRLVSREDRLPEYTSGDVSTLVREKPEFAVLVSEVQELLGSVLNSNALIDLMGFYDYLGLPPDVILMLVAYCIEEQERKYGEGKRPTMRVIRAEAYRWADRGILTLESAGEYMKSLERSRRRQSEIRRALGLQDRKLSSTEERFVRDWAELELDDEMISAAYDKTVLNTGRFVWKYMDSILRSWVKQGFKSMDEVNAGDRKPEASSHAQQPGEAAGGESNEGQEEMEYLRKYLKKLEQG